MNSQKNIKKNKQRKNNAVRNIITLGVIAFCSFIFTTYIMLNAYEQVFLRHIEFINAIRPVKNNSPLEKLVLSDPKISYVKYPMNTDQLRYIHIPQIKTQIELAQSIYRNGQWYIRGNKAHLIYQQNNNDVIVYLDENWRTTLSMGSLKPNDLVFLMSNKSDYIFRVDQEFTDITKYKLEPNQDSIPQLTIFSEDKNGYQIFTALLINSSSK